MSIEPTTSVRTVVRPRSSIRNLAIAILAAIPIGACSSGGADEPAAADAAEATAPTRPTDEGSPTVTAPVPSTAPSRALFGTPGERFEPGKYFVDNFEGTTTPRVHLTIGPEWSNGFDGWAIDKQGNNGYITFSRPDAVLTDACHPSDGYHPGPMTTLDGLVAALSEQKGWADVSTPSDISIDGYAGRAFQRTTPTDLSGCPREYAPPPTELLYPVFPSWENVGDDGARGWSYYGPGETETLWVLDVDGTIVIVNARVAADKPAKAHAELAAVLDSIRIDRG